MPKKTILIVCIAAIGAALALFAGGRERIGSYLPFLLILLCPLAHILFMRHADHGNHPDTEAKKKTKPPNAPSCH